MDLFEDNNLIQIDVYKTMILIDHLRVKYPYLGTKKRIDVADIIHTCFYEYLLMQTVFDDFNWKVVEKIMQGKCNDQEIFFGHDKISEKYRIISKHKLTDFKIINWAIHFYGKPLDGLIEDIMHICNRNHPIFFHIKTPALLETFMHLLKYELLTAFGLIFYYLENAILLKCMDVNLVDETCKSIISYIRTGEEYILNMNLSKNWYDKLGVVHDKLDKQLKKYETNEYSKNFYYPKFKILYDNYHCVTKIESMDDEQLQKFVEENLDIKMWLSDIHKSQHHGLLLRGFHYLIGMLSLETEHVDTSNDILTPNLLDLDDTQLQIEL